MIQETTRGRNQDVTLVRENYFGFGILTDGIGLIKRREEGRHMVLLGTAHDMLYFEWVPG